VPNLINKGSILVLTVPPTPVTTPVGNAVAAPLLAKPNTCELVFIDLRTQSVVHREENGFLFAGIDQNGRVVFFTRGDCKVHQKVIPIIQSCQPEVIDITRDLKGDY